MDLTYGWKKRRAADDTHSLAAALWFVSPVQWGTRTSRTRYATVTVGRQTRYVVRAMVLAAWENLSPENHGVLLRAKSKGILTRLCDCGRLRLALSRIKIATICWLLVES